MKKASTTLSLSSLSPAPGSRKRKIRVGLGESSGHGKTCGKGNKGQSARAGYGHKPGFEGGQMPLYRRIPKRGFTSRKQVVDFNQYEIINLGVLERFESGTVVDQSVLKQAKLVKRNKVKLLVGGNLTKKLNLKVDAISSAAKAKLESLGGSVEIVSLE